MLANLQWLFLDKLLRMAGGLIVGLWVARYLGPQQYGTLNFSMAFVAPFAAIAGLGLQSIVVRDVVSEPAAKWEILGTAAVLNFLGGVLSYILILISIFSLEIDSPVTKVLVSILGLTMLSKVADFVTYWFESQTLYKYVVWVQNGTFLLFATIKILLILNKSSLVMFAWIAVAELLVVAIMLFFIFELHGIRLRYLHVTFSRCKILLMSGWPLMLSDLLVLANMNVDKIFMMKLHGAVETGIYSAASAIASIFFFLPMIIGATVAPWLTQLHKIKGDEYKNAVLKLNFLLISIMGLISLFVLFTSDTLVRVMYGQSYIAASDSLKIFVFSIIFISIVSIRGRILTIEGKEKHVAFMAFVGFVLNVVFLYFLVPQNGAVGAAIAFLLSWSLNSIIYPIAFFKK